MLFSQLPITQAPGLEKSRSEGTSQRDEGPSLLLPFREEDIGKRLGQEVFGLGD
jgi:hypothetical protein